jgi:hypothetical protein
VAPQPAAPALDLDPTPAPITPGSARSTTRASSSGVRRSSAMAFLIMTVRRLDSRLEWTQPESPSWSWTFRQVSNSAMISTGSPLRASTQLTG